MRDCPSRVDPREHDTRLGHATLDPAGEIIAGSIGTWKINYTTGDAGISPGGSLLLARSWPADWGQPQWDDPAKRDYTTFSTTGQSRLAPRFERKLIGLDWNPHAIHALFVTVQDHPLMPGERITVTFGDTGAGSPGMLAQTFLEEESRLYAAVDPDGSDEWQPLSPLPAMRVVGGPAERLVVIAPTVARPGESFDIALRVEDAWGNPSPAYRGRVQLETGETYQFDHADAGVGRLSHCLMTSGVHRLRVTGEAGELSAISNPIVCSESPSEYRLFWGDLHGQSRMGCGARSVENFLRHAHDVAAVDFAADQANDHYLTRGMWQETARVVRELHDPGRFVIFLGYEWSGETADGGDHNVYFLDDEGPIRRSSHSLIADKSEAASDLGHITEVYDQFRGQRTLMIPHVGGRPANLAWHDPALEPAIEIHSSHATSEWFLHEALERGYRVGVVAGSDDVMGRPGASSPGNHAGRNVRGGLTAVYARELTREAIWEAIKARRCYATTGPRIFLSVTADGHLMGEAYPTDTPPAISVHVEATSELETVELFRGSECIHNVLCADYSRVKPDAIRLYWSGANARGGGPRARLIWDGELTLDAGEILDVKTFAFDSPATGVCQVENRRIVWHSHTAGDRDGLLIRHRAPADALFHFSTEPASFSFRLADLDEGPIEIEAGPVERRVVVSQMPAEPGALSCRFTIIDNELMPGVNPYYVRVTQADGERVWSSPIFVSYR